MLPMLRGLYNVETSDIVNWDLHQPFRHQYNKTENNSVINSVYCCKFDMCKIQNEGDCNIVFFSLLK